MTQEWRDKKINLTSIITVLPHCHHCPHCACWRCCASPTLMMCVACASRPLVKIAKAVAPALHLHFDQLPCSLAGHLVIGGRKACRWPFRYQNDHFDERTVLTAKLKKLSSKWSFRWWTRIEMVISTEDCFVTTYPIKQREVPKYVNHDRDFWFLRLAFRVDIPSFAFCPHKALSLAF
jgi:hypothetical protein